jgi:K(+)-stimulated pyrophosphate-energized sodium pump
MSHMSLTAMETTAIYAVLLVAVLSLVYAWLLRRSVMAEATGTPAMVRIWTAVKEGADAYLGQQLRTIVPFIGVLLFVLFASVWVAVPSPEAKRIYGANAQIIIAFGRACAFILGATFSLLVGQLGMRMAVQGNIRVAAAAVRNDFGAALRIAYRSGTITGMLTDGLGLLGGTTIFIIFGEAAPDALLGFAFGGTLLALFMRVGGGIYTKAADVGADLVGKVEEGLEEDDPRNAAVIADQVGDNVGDCAGMAADIFESYEVTIVSALILGLALVTITGNVYWIVFPLIVRAIGVISSIVGTFSVPIWERTVAKGNAWHSMEIAYEVSSVITIVLSTALAWFYVHATEAVHASTGTPGLLDAWWKPAAMVTTGVVFNVIVNRLTAHFTDADQGPVQEIAKSTSFGPATTILSGLAEGYESSVWAVFAIAAAIMVSVLVYSAEGMQYVIYGVALIGIGWLTHAGNLVSMDAFGPISDNAQGIIEMSHQQSAITHKLDAVGNTTKAITKGVAIGSAVIAAVALFGSFMTDIAVVQKAMVAAGTLAQKDVLAVINIADPSVFIGFLIGGGVPLLFGSLLVKAVSRAANGMVAAVRQQFKVPGVREGKVLPDYKMAVAISTTAAQRELLPVGIIVLLLPIVVGFLLGAAALGGFLAGVILSGQLLAVFMSNAGGAWDNAKKVIEDGKYGGKGSDAHKASIVGDTVGDPLKDTAGPALNPLIKVINLISAIIAPIVIAYRQPTPVIWVVCLILIGIMVWAVMRSKRPADYGIEAALTKSVKPKKALAGK